MSNGTSSLQKSAMAGEAFLRQVVASAGPRQEGGTGGPQQSPRPPLSKQRPQSARDASGPGALSARSALGGVTHR